MIKIGFRSFIFGMVRRASTSLFEEWKSAEEEKASKEQTASFLASGVTAFGNVGGAIKTLGFDPFTSYREAISRGQGRLLFQVQRAFTPLLNEIRWNSNLLNLTTGDVFLRNSEGLAIGQGVGTVLQGIATAIYPPLAPLWMVFPWLGGMFGVAIQQQITSDELPVVPFLLDQSGLVYIPTLPPPPDPNAGPDIFVDPGPTQPITANMPAAGTFGRLRKIWLLEITGGTHWM